MNIKMDAIPEDTTVDAAVKQFEILRQLGIEARAEMTFQLSDNLHQTVEAGVRYHHPDFDEKKVRLEVLRLMIGDKLYQQILKEAGKQL